MIEGRFLNYLKRLLAITRFRMHHLFSILKRSLARIFLSNVFFDIVNFVLSAAASGGIFYFGTGDNYPKDIFSTVKAFLIITFIALTIMALIAFFLKGSISRKRKTAFRQINEIMNESFNLLLTYFSGKMSLIHEASSKAKVIGYLKDISEERLFASLATSLNGCLKNLFPSDELEVKIDIFKYANNSLVPLLDTMVNGSFIQGKKSHTFAVTSNVTEYTSLAEYTFARTKVGFISNVARMEELLNLLPPNDRVIFQNKYHLYYEHHAQTEGFQPGTILTFPLHKGELRYGVLSIAFRPSSLTGPLRFLGISESEFISNISTFMARYTEFVIATNNGIDRISNLLQDENLDQITVSANTSNN